jgi:glutamyl-tRNA reductase
MRKKYISKLKATTKKAAQVIARLNNLNSLVIRNCNRLEVSCSKWERADQEYLQAEITEISKELFRQIREIHCSSESVLSSCQMEIHS